MLSIVYTGAFARDLKRAVKRGKIQVPERCRLCDGKELNCDKRL